MQPRSYRSVAELEREELTGASLDDLAELSAGSMFDLEREARSYETSGQTA